MNLHFRKIISTLTLIALLLTSIPVDVFADQSGYTLAPWLALRGGTAQRLVYFALHVPRIVYAESDSAKALLNRYSADALLLQNGACLVDKSIFDNNARIIALFEARDITQILKEAEASPAVARALFKLTRVILHENIEKLMRVIAATDRNRYIEIEQFVLSQKNIVSAYNEFISAASRKRPPTNDLLLNDIVASAFELILLKKAGIIDKGSLNAVESYFAQVAELVFAANKHNYFDASFWDERELNKAVTKSLHVGYAGAPPAHSKTVGERTTASHSENPKTLKEKIAILNKDLKFTPPSTFEERFALYYILRLSLISDADQDKADDFRLHYRQMLALLEAIGADLKTVKDDKIAKLAKEVAQSGKIPDFVLGQPYAIPSPAETAAAIRKELTGLTTLEFDKKTRGGIDACVSNIVEELYDDEANRQSMKTELASGIKTYHFANFIPIDSLEDDFSIHRESYRDGIIALPMALGAYACKISGEDLILTHAFSDSSMTMSSLVHEIFHYLADRGEVKMPAGAESITFTAQFLDAITHAPGGDKERVLSEIERDTGLPLFRELLNRGMELGLKGEVGFKVLPGLTGEHAEYFSLKGLLLEAQIIFKDNGLDPALLDHPYAAQMAIAAMLTGQLLGLHEKDGIRPLRFLKDFFSDLFRRCAPPSPEFLAWIHADGGLLSELKKYASYLFAKRMALANKAEGLWSYADKSELTGVINYVETDLYPRSTDGIDENDIEGKKEAVRERALAQLILAVSRELYGRHELAERSIPEWKTRPERRLLWDGALTANTVYAALGRNQTRNKDQDGRERYSGAGLWITRLFRDRYQIGNPVIERALLISLPFHLQYLDSILYRWAFYDSTKGSLADPRLVSEKVKEALILTQGGADDPGWEALMFHAGQFKDDEIINIVRDRMLPVYERLYDDAVKDAERKAAYEQMIKDEKAENMRKAIDQFTEKELDAIDKYLGGLSDDERREIKERAKEKMREALQEYMERSQGQKMPFMDEAPREIGESGAGQQGMAETRPGKANGRGKIGKGESLAGDIDSLKEKMDALERTIDRLSDDLDKAESKTGGAGKLSEGVQAASGTERIEAAGRIDSLAEDIRADVNASLQKGRDIEAGASNIRDGASDIAGKMPEKESALEARRDSESLANDGADLRERMERLQEEANRLKAIAERLKATVSGGETDESHARGQSDAISDTAGTMKEMIKDIKGKSAGIEDAMSKLERDLERIEAMARDIDKRKGASKKTMDGLTQSEDAQWGEGEAGSQTAPTTTSGDIAPTDDTLEGLADIARKCGSDLSREAPEKRLREERPIFDDRFLKGLAQEEAEKDRLRESLTEEEHRLYDEWLQVAKPVIDRMTVDLRARLNIPNVGIELDTGQWAGPKLKDLVKGVMGLPPFAKRQEKEPRRVKITLLVDRSGSMRGERIKYAALTVFTLLNTVFNLNEELERLGFDPIEFEAGLFTTEEAMDKELQISHETVANKPHICRERLIYNIMRKIEAGGGTDDVSALGRYVTRIIESPDRGTESSYRIFVSIGDANLGTDSNTSDIRAIIQNAKERGIHIFGVSVGDDAAREHMKQVYGADNSILPNSLTDLPGDIMKKINECIPMPRRTAGISSLTSYLPWAFPLTLGLDHALRAASKFLLNTNINNVAKTRALKQVEGYRHFYIERFGDNEYLVFKKDGVPERRWLRGVGGAYVPQVKVPDIDANEESILSLLNAQEDFGQNQLIELIGETGIGKGEILRAAARLLNEEYHFIAGNEDMEVEDLSETRSLGNAAAGVSGYEPSVIAQVQHNGGWVALDERNKIPQKVLNQLKSHLSGRNHVWNELDGEGRTVKKTVPNHPRARIFSTINPHRAGIQSVAGVLDQAMQRRVKRVEFTWLPPKEEIQMQSSYAEDFAKGCGKDYSGDLKSDIEAMIERLVRIAVKERLTFAGYNAAQIGRIIADWRLLKDRNFKSANKRGEYLKRPPSPRVIKNIIRHMILYPEDLRHRPWSIVLSYFNYEAENDKLNTFSNVATDFSAEGITDDTAAHPLKLDALSFTVDNGHLVIRPISASGEKSAWDDVRVPLSPDASIRRGELPERVKFWIRTGQNAIMLYRALQSIELGRDIIFVGEQETGKSKLAEAIAELLSGPELEIQPITFSTSKEDITFTPHIGEDGAKAFQSGYKMQRLSRAMDDGKGRGKILIMEETTQGRPGIIAILNEVAERGELPYPFSKKVIRKQEGFAIIHTINPPTKDYDVNAFSDEFLERHTIMGFKPLPPEEAYRYISDASKREGLQVHPRLIGEVERDGKGDVVMINGRPKYKGVLGIEQNIRDMRAKDPGLFPRAPGVGTNMSFAASIRNNYEFYRSYYGLNSQETLMKIFTELFTLDGSEEKVREWHSRIKSAFVYAQLWTDEAGKDAVDEYLRGEDILVEGLPVLRKPYTGIDDLDRMLTYIQENTRGVRFKEMLDAVYERCAKIYDDSVWAGLGFGERMERVYILKEAYQVARAILSARSAQMYDTEDWKKFELIRENIVSNLLIKKHWPDEALTAEYTKEELMKRYEGIASSSDMEIDDLVGKMALFYASDDYADEVFRRLRDSLKARMGRVISLPVTADALKNLAILYGAKTSLDVIARKSENKGISSLIEEIAACLILAHAPQAGSEISERIAQVNSRIEEVRARIKNAAEGAAGHAPDLQAPSLDNLDLEKTSLAKTVIGKDMDIDITLSGPAGVSFSPDGKTIAIANCGNSTVSIIDIKTKELLTIGKDKDIDITLSSPRGVSFSPDGKTIAVANSGNDTVSMIDIKTKKLLTIGEGKNINTPLSDPYGVSFSPDGKTIAIANSGNDTVSIIDIKTKKLLTIGEGKNINTPLSDPYGVSFSPDGKTIAIANYGNSTVSIIDIETKKLLTIGVGMDINTPLSSPEDVSFSSDNKRIVVANRGNSTVSIIDIKTKKLLYTIGEGKNINTPLSSPEDVSFSPDNKKIAIANFGNHTVVIIDFIAKDAAQKAADTPTAVAANAADELKRLNAALASLEEERGILEKLALIHEKIAAVNEETARLSMRVEGAAADHAPDLQAPSLDNLDLEKTSLAKTVIGKDMDIDITLSNPDSVSFSPDGKTIAIANYSNSTVSIIDIKTKKLLTIGEGKGMDIDTPLYNPNCVSFSPDGKTIAVANCGNHTVSIIDIETKKLLTIGEGMDIDTPLFSPAGVSFSSDNKTIAIANYSNSTVSIIDIKTKELLTIGEGKNINTPLSDPYGVSFSPDGKTIAIANYGNSTVSIIDIKTKELLTIGKGKGMDIDTLLSNPYGVSFSPDGKTIAIANYGNHTVSIIDIETKKLLTIGGGMDIDTPLSSPEDVSFSPDNKKIAIANFGNHTVVIIEFIAKDAAQKAADTPTAVAANAADDLKSLQAALASLEEERGILEKLALIHEKIAAVNEETARLSMRVEGAAGHAPDLQAPSLDNLDLEKTSLAKTVIGKDMDIDITLSNPDSVSFSPDGKTIAIANYGNHTVSIIDIKTKELLTIGKGMDIDTLLSNPYGVSFSPDGKTIAIANFGNHTVSIIDIKTKELLTIGIGMDINTPLSNPRGVSFSPDGKTIAVANCGNHTVSIIDIKTKKLLYTIGKDKDIDTPLSNPEGVSFSPDNKTIAVANFGNHTVVIIEFIAKDAAQKAADTPTAVAANAADDLKSLHAALVSLEKERDTLERQAALAQKNAAQVIPESKSLKEPPDKGKEGRGDDSSSKIMPSAHIGNINDRALDVFKVAPQIAVGSMTGVDTILRNDTAMSVGLFCVNISSILEEGRRYEIRYNNRILGDSYGELMEEYISILNARFSSSEFKLVKSSFDDGRLLETKCYLKNGAGHIGEGAVSVIPEEGELREYFIRVAAMINITIAASSIADSGSNEYERLIRYIASQYRSLSAVDLALTGDAARDVDIVKHLSIVLPKTYRINPDTQALNNDMMRALLKDA